MSSPYTIPIFSTGIYDTVQTGNIFTVRKLMLHFLSAKFLNYFFFIRINKLKQLNYRTQNMIKKTKKKKKCYKLPTGTS